MHAIAPSAADIDALLPQTQCTRCGYDGCRPYAEAMARGEAALNRCPPGGSAVITALAHLLNQPALPLNPDCGTQGPATVAWIDAEACIGCARCLPPCPVDAIVGAQRHLHTIISDWCTGCELCLAACPVDCIHMRSAATLPSPAANRHRYEAHRERLGAQVARRAALLAERKQTRLPPTE